MTTILLIARACTGTEPVLPEPDLAYALRPFTVAHGDRIGRCNDSDAHQPCHHYTADAELDLAVCDRTTTCDRYVELRGWILIDDMLGDQLSIAANCEPEKPVITSGPSVGTRVCISAIQISQSSGLGIVLDPASGSWKTNGCGPTWIAERVSELWGVRSSGPLPVHRAFVDTVQVTIHSCMEPAQATSSPPTPRPSASSPWNERSTSASTPVHQRLDGLERRMDQRFSQLDGRIARAMFRRVKTLQDPEGIPR